MSAARRKKDTEAPAGTPVTRTLDMLGRLARKEHLGGVGFKTLADIEWNWIDFADPILHTPCLLLEWLWGCRGYLSGRMMKIEAMEGVGKSSLLMMTYGFAQQTSKAWCIHAEGESALAPADFNASFGCDPAAIMRMDLEKRAIDECFNKIDWMAYGIRRPPANDKDTMIIDPEGLYPIVVGVDSVSSFGASANMEDDGAALASGQAGLGLHSRFLSQWFRDKWSLQEKRKMFLMCVTQLREKIVMGGFPGQPPPPKTDEGTTIASKPLNYHASYRLEMKSRQFRFKGGDSVGPQVGEIVTMKTTKNKLSPKGKTADVRLLWDKGWDLATATITKLYTLGTLELPSGGKFEVERNGAGSQGAYLEIPAAGIKVAYRGGEDGTEYPKACAEAVQLLYQKSDLLMSVREALRIRGYGFKFEQNYMPSPEEVADQTMTEDEAAAAGPAAPG